MLDELKDDYTNEINKATKASLMQNYLIIGEYVYVPPYLVMFKQATGTITFLNTHMYYL